MWIVSYSFLNENFFFQIVVDDYAQSFRDVLSFEKSNPKDPKVLKAFSEAVHKVRERHTNTVIIMAEAVMEMKNNAQRHGQSNGQFGCGILKMVGPKMQHSRRIFLKSILQ